MTLEIIKLDGLARLALKTTAEGLKWHLPTIVLPVMHQAAIKQMQSMPHHRATLQRLMVARDSLTSKITMESSNELVIKEQLVPLVIEVLPSVQFQEFDLDVAFALRRDEGFLLLPVDRVLFQTDQYGEYLDRIISSGIVGEKASRIALAFPYLGKGENLSDISKKIEKISPEIIVLSDIHALLKHPKRLLRYLTQYHRVTNGRYLTWAPRISSEWVPFLAYLGVDLFDLLLVEASTKLNVFRNRFGQVTDKIFALHSLFERYSSGHSDDIGMISEKNGSGRFRGSIFDWNVRFFLDVLAEMIIAISSGRLRDLVRSTANINPSLKLALRLLGTDEYLLELLEGNVPLQLSDVLWCTDETDVDRPEVTRYQKWTRARWFPPEEVACCIILPCSSKKPYRASQSHYLFTKVIQSTLGKWYALTQEIIFTSPFGGVPRPLDMSHPVSFYDVTVTGEWTIHEIERSASHLRDLVAKLPENVPVVVHLSDVETEVVEPYLSTLPHQIHYVGSKEPPSKEESLDQLKNVLEEVRKRVEQTFLNAKGKMDRKKSLQSDYEILRTVLAYQFGSRGNNLQSSDVVEDFLKEPLKIRGKRRIQLKFYRGDRQLGTFHGNNGLITLTIHGAEILAEHGINLVKVNTRELRGGTVYLPAIVDADPEIVPGSSVAVVDVEDPTNLLASGKALLPGRYLKVLSRGAGVTIKHKKKK